MQAGLVERAQRGDQEAFAALAGGAIDRCYAVAFRILRDIHLAQDATQQALLAAWRDLPTLRDPERFEAWLYRLVVRSCYVEAARHRRAGTQVRLIATDQVASPDTAGTIADRDELERGFSRLSPDHRVVIVLRHYLGYPLEEIAAVLDIPVGTARSRLHYATSQLRAAIEADARPMRPEERTA